MRVEAFVIVLSLLAACGGITVTLLMQAQADASRTIRHVAAFNALACSRIDERALPPR